MNRRPPPRGEPRVHPRDELVVGGECLGATAGTSCIRNKAKFETDNFFFIHSFIHSFIHAFIYSFIHSFIHLLLLLFLLFFKTELKPDLKPNCNSLLQLFETARLSIS